ncbi:uncharacterized protein [Clinocottus analis]|uniref:uncharacterized protein n=1 Tax=Clinocottus analis TaxID=304258 RepID=UPI0035C10C83
MLDINHVPLPPPRRESYHFSPTAANPPDYSSLVALANDFTPGMLTFTQNEKAALKESYTISSTSSYSYSESNASSAQQAQQFTLPGDISSCRASASTNSQAQERKVSSLKLTPVTIPDPPDHCDSHLDPQPKSQTTGPPSPPQRGPAPTKLLTQAAPTSVGLDPEDLKHPERRPANTTAELKSPDRGPNQTPNPAPAWVEVTRDPPAVPPRPSPAVLLVHN